MTTPAVDQLLYLLDEAFAGEDWRPLLTNLGAAPLISEFPKDRP